MNLKSQFFLFVAIIFMSACSNPTSTEKVEKTDAAHGHSDGHNHEDHAGHHHSAPAAELKDLLYEQEKHITNVKQLTFGGDNAEAILVLIIKI